MSQTAPFPQELPPCQHHPDRLCPGECQYVLARDQCIHDSPAAAAWRWVVRRIGGIYEIGKLSLVIHDRGVNLSWVDGLVERWRVGR
jgi:hypothetical protein